MFKNILFVCIGNICRSPLAEYWARDQLKKKGLDNIQVSSAGIHAMRESPIAKESQAILNQFHIDSTSHVARQINQEIIDVSEIIFTMESWHKDELAIAFPNSRGKIFTLGKWKDEEIVDPYRQDFAVFETVFELIKENWGIWQSKLWNV